MRINRLLNLLLILPVSVLIMFLGSCSYKQNQAYFENNSGGQQAPVKADDYKPTEYKIKTGDILQVRNLQSIKLITDDATAAATADQAPSGSGSRALDYQVESDGTIALPVIGRVAVAGLSRLETSKKLDDIYRQNVLKNPIIEVKVINLKVTLMGEVKKPGNYSLLKDETTLMEMLGEAGGLTEKGNEKKVKILRGGGLQSKQIIEVDLDDVAALSNPSTILQNQDIIYVEQNRRAIRNEKLQNITTIAQPALLLLNTALIILTLRK
ncbi:polysaccharide biosynthesis/export family protein [Mucilaginibacter sabulilitoris]|uniref:Polysaccharide biosynthesis/export family protein n=1 Tax=Mucilaginibacter sabulilitoris TaxID=1173583 RepID=A0ABZ0TUG3_9SPHI|nr:polysaccharide biosynthesis/export family protein [Mucilaginibacter sabulilitoris]WPU96749.1 polysaccharide biosynthesis/export family protein [Mucilaginibacter sabulilitoris]